MRPPVAEPATVTAESAPTELRPQADASAAGRGSHLAKRAHSVADLRRLARRRLPRMVFDFVDGGAEDERTLRANEAAFGEVELWPRPLNGTATRDLSVELFGERLALPVLIGPTGLAGMLWPRGEVEAARAAHAAGTVYTMSHGSTVSMEDLAKAAPGGLNWFQNFMYRDRGLTRSFAERAQAAGYRALVLTTDNQVLGWRERDLRNGFTIPPRPTARSALDMALRLPWLLRMRQSPVPRFANYITEERGDLLALGSRMPDMLDPAASWTDVAWLRSLWSGPLLLKGVLHPDEARAAIDHGVDGVIVSNHGGRQLDGAPAAVRALPAVAEAVQGRIPVLMDGGVRRGADVVKALALGATACLIGRPHLWGLAVAGGEGVAFVLEVYRREIDRVLALCGWDGVGVIDRNAAVRAAQARFTSGTTTNQTV